LKKKFFEKKNIIILDPDQFYHTVLERVQLEPRKNVPLDNSQVKMWFIQFNLSCLTQILREVKTAL